ncbi:MAG: DUF2294 family protein [Actinobacteria bacterium]|nr:DUF2294 family protein [Actinomycetota bacterium]
MSRDIVKVHARLYGRGPTRAKTIWRDGIVCCVLEDVFTTAERVLVGGGHFEEVRSQRIAFAEQVGPLLRRAVEMSTRHYVDAFLSQISKDGVISEVFVLGDHVGATELAPPSVAVGDRSSP